jgi:hypothetical protein
MRFLHAKTIQLKEFPENELPPYAILSHTWEREEVSFQDMQGSNAARKEGYAKIKYACDQAIKDDLGYVWVDTCCIDKCSSSELSEAINSMFCWYRNAQTCYAYLADVPPDQDPRAEDSLFRRSRWFTRGWTLQELIAPADVHFYARDWTSLGPKSWLFGVIAETTGIGATYLCGGDLRVASIAKRMSWASKRTTTRKEDIAYCLLGIFGVNMPMLYGEGEKAFIRLQEEIIKESDDQSLFAWGLDLPSINKPSGILAESPAYFATAGNIIPCRSWNAKIPHHITSKGLRIELPLYSISSDANRKGLYALPSCQFENNFFNILAIPLSNVSPSKDEFERLGWSRPTFVAQDKWHNVLLQTIYIKKTAHMPTRAEDRRQDCFLIRRLPHKEHGYCLTEVYPPDSWNATRGIISTYSGYEEWLSMRAFMLFKNADKDDLIVILEYRPNRPTFGLSKAHCHIAFKPNDRSLEQLHREYYTAKFQTKFYLSQRKIASISVSKQAVLGIQMFVVDVNITESSQGFGRVH